MKRIMNTILLVIIIYPTVSYANIDLQSTINEQESSFGIRSFLKEAQNYMPDYMDEINITDTFNLAVQGNIDNSKFINKITSLFRKQNKKHNKNFSKYTYNCFNT